MTYLIYLNILSFVYFISSTLSFDSLVFYPKIIRKDNSISLCTIPYSYFPDKSEAFLEDSIQVSLTHCSHFLQHSCCSGRHMSFFLCHITLKKLRVIVTTTYNIVPNVLLSGIATCLLVNLLLYLHCFIPVVDTIPHKGCHNLPCRGKLVL